ncbi:MAG: DNA alkylation repair protein, partial [Acidimicrobiia bacterium]
MEDRVRFVRRELSALADPVKASEMAAYLKTNMAFYGVQKPRRTPVFKEMLARFPVASRAEYRAAVLQLWQRPHREEKYFAIGLAGAYPEYRTVGSIPLYKRLIVEGGWWDLVDGVASDLVGGALRDDRVRVAPIMRRWIEHPDMWLRRTALICQIGHRGATDQDMLFEFCLRCATDPEWFIRKAIGWALREYGKTSPSAVAEFTRTHEERWSRLTYREAMKHLG